MFANAYDHVMLNSNPPQLVSYLDDQTLLQDKISDETPVIPSALLLPPYKKKTFVITSKKK